MRLRALGRAKRLPLVPLAAMTLPMLAARQRVYVTDAEQLTSTLSEADLGINLFQTVTGAVIARRVMDAYDQAVGIGAGADRRAAHLGRAQAVGGQMSEPLG